jgi:hypothetical protein
MKKNEMIRAWKSTDNKEEISNAIGSPEINKEVVKGGATRIDSSGYICSVSGECWGGWSCDPRDWF